MNVQRLTEAAFLIGIAFGRSLVAQKPSLNQPSARRADVIDNCFGTKVADPYRWMEDLNSPELKQWIDAENALVNGTLYMLTDRDAPNRKVVAVPIDRPDPSNWKTIVPETKNAIETAQLVGGTIAVTALVDVAGDVRFHNLDGTAAWRIATPGLGSIAGPFGRYGRPEIFYTFTSPLYPVTVFRFDLATGNSSPFEAPTVTFDPIRYRTERVFVVSKDGTRVPAFITHHKGLRKDGANTGHAVRVWRVRSL
jgi:prolyl oligopeptidase